MDDMDVPPHELAEQMRLNVQAAVNNVQRQIRLIDDEVPVPVEQWPQELVPEPNLAALQQVDIFGNVDRNEAGLPPQRNVEVDPRLPPEARRRQRRARRRARRQMMKRRPSSSSESEMTEPSDDGGNNDGGDGEEKEAEMEDAQPAPLARSDSQLKALTAHVKAEAAAQQFAGLLGDDLMSDLVLVVGEPPVRLPAHRLVLALSSEVLRTVLFPARTERGPEPAVVPAVLELPAKDFAPQAVEAMLRCLYTGNAPVASAAVFESLYKLERLLRIPKLRALCLRHLTRDADVADAVSLFLLAVHHGDDEARNLVIRRFGAAMIKAPRFFQMREADVLTVFSSELLVAPEVDIFRAAQSWGKLHCQKRGLAVNPTNVRSVANSLLMLVRYPTMVPRDFGTVVVPSQLLTLEEILSVYVAMGMSQMTPTRRPPLRFPCRFSSVVRAVPPELVDFHWVESGRGIALLGRAIRGQPANPVSLARGNLRMPPRSGQRYWEIVIEVLPPPRDFLWGVGIGSLDAALEWQPFRGQLAMILNQGAFVHRGAHQQFALGPLQRGERIGVLFDSDSRRIIFYRNGDEVRRFDDLNPTVYCPMALCGDGVALRLVERPVVPASAKRV